MKLSTDKLTNQLKGKILYKFNFKSDEFLLNKLKFTSFSLSDSYERKKIINFQTTKYQIRHFETYLMREGFLLINSRTICHKRGNPRLYRNKIYISKQNTSIDYKKVNPLRHQSKIDERVISTCSNIIIKKLFDYSIFKTSLNERLNRQIRLIKSLIDLKILDLQRISFWKKLLGNIKVENWKFLDKSKFEDLV